MTDAQGTEPLPVLDEAELELLAAFAAEEGMPAEAREHVWADIVDDVEASTPAPVIPLAPRRRRVGAGVIVAALAVAAAVALLVMGPDRAAPVEPAAERVEAPYGHESEGMERVQGRQPTRGGDTGPEPERVTPPAPAPSEPEPTHSDAAHEDTADTEAEDGAGAGVRKGRRPARVRTERDTTPAPAPEEPGEPGEPGEPEGTEEQEGETAAPLPSLAEETRYLRRARAALAAGEPARAQELLDECARRFPDGLLVEERSALRVIALCEGGTLAQGRGEARWFLSKYPRSPLAARVRAACPAK